MLRRFTSASSVVASSSKCILTATTAVATRNVFVFSEQSDVLTNNAKHLKYKSNVWVESDKDAYWFNKVTKVKDGEKPTEATIDRLMEYYNGDCFTEKSLQGEIAEAVAAAKAAAKKGASTANMQVSFASKKPFSKSVAAMLEKVAKTRNYQSNVWVAASSVRINGHRLNKYARPTHVIIPTPAKLLNADQFENPQAIAQSPVSAYKKAPYGGETLAALQKDVASKKYPTGLYFTASQLETFGLKDALPAKAPSVEVDIQITANKDQSAFYERNDKSKMKVFNVADEVEGGEALMEELNRCPVEEHSYLISGKPVLQAQLLEALKKNESSFPSKSKYWISENDLKFRKFSLKAGAKGVEAQMAAPVAAGAAEGKSTQKVTFYNVAVLAKDKQQGAFKVAGTKATN